MKRTKMDPLERKIGTWIIALAAIMVISVFIAGPPAAKPAAAEKQTEVTQAVVEVTIPSASEEATSEEAEVYIEEEAEELPDFELVEFELPSKFYGDTLDFSSFQPYMDYRMVTDTTSLAYSVCYSENAYTDNEGFRRIAIQDGYKVGQADDYVIALGTYYNPHMTAGSRWLIVTSNGSYTATVGDEKQDAHTDEYHMFGVHGENRDIAGMIEWIVNTDQLEQDIKTAGSVTAGSNPIHQGEIIGIYRIDEN